VLLKARGAEDAESERPTPAAKSTDKSVCATEGERSRGRGELREKRAGETPALHEPRRGGGEDG
jgi:hypothetical protein